MRQRFIFRVWASRWTPMFVVLALLGTYYAYRNLGPGADPMSTYELNGDLLVHGNPSLKEIALTFDDGPYGETTEDILQTLKNEQLPRRPSSSSVLTSTSGPNWSRKIMASGHEVGNHTFSHPRLTQITNEQAREELLKCEQAVFEATGAHMNLMRPPGMKFDDGLLRLNQELGYTTIHWNALAGDYVSVDPQMIVKRILWQVRPGSVILLHDTPATAAALPELLRRLKADGYRFVTVTQMLARLPRPVFLASNAGKVSVVEDPVVEVAPVKRRKPVRPAAKAPPLPPTQRPSFDDPVWDGGSGEESEGEAAIA